MIILDTNVVSEPTQARPSRAVMNWLTAQEPANLYTTTVTEAEIQYGIALMPHGRRRHDLETAIRGFFQSRIEDRILAFDHEAAIVFGTITAERKKAGRRIKIFDTQIASIARSHRAAIATRDVGDFEHAGVRIINPWDT